MRKVAVCLAVLLAGCKEDPDPGIPCVRDHVETQTVMAPMIIAGTTYMMPQMHSYSVCDARADCSQWRTMSPSVARACLGHLLWKDRNQPGDQTP